MNAPHIDQQEVIAFLSSPSAYGPACHRVDRIDTHISVVFLAADRAYKLKRAVHLPYVDYSTLEMRRRFCEAEVRLNRRTAADLYLGVLPVSRTENGTLAIAGPGGPVEWVVQMRRFDERMLLDQVARRGALDVGLAAKLGVAAARLHTAAEPRRDHGGTSAMQWVVDENDAELSGASVAIDRQLRDHLHRRSLEALWRDGELLDTRRRDGWVRECHGDLHLGNVFLGDAEPAIFDGIEFNEALSCIDVLYDVAFLVMDLIHRGLPTHANAALNAWLETLPQYDALRLLPLFLSCRAAIRAKVLITESETSSDPGRRAGAQREAAVYLQHAARLIEPGRGGIVAIGGLSGTGKSTLARRLASCLGAPVGAVVLRSDVARKRRFGIEPTMQLPNQAYEPDVSESVYDELTRAAQEVTRAGYIAVVDAVFATDALRQKIRDAASRAGVPFIALWLEARTDVMERRLATRTADASDATVDVLHWQQQHVSVPVDWKGVDASVSPDQVLGAALQCVDGKLPALEEARSS